MYLKALFLYEHRDSNLTCNELWAILEAKIKEDKTKEDRRVRDQNGNIVYYQTVKDQNGYEIPLRHPDGSIIYVYAKVDSLGVPIKDNNGKQIYIDKFENEYNENNKGKAVKTNGHSLDRLVELMLPESRLYLETRMLTIPMYRTEQNNSVSIQDILQKNGLLSPTAYISQEQFAGWLDEHKKTFEEARYSGQKRYDVSIEFMYHLTTQIRAVVQYQIVPEDNQKFTIKEEKFEKMAPEIKQFISFYSESMSEQLIKLIISDDNTKNKILWLLSKQYKFPSKISQKNFYNMIKLFDINEINYVLELCTHYDQINSSNKIVMALSTMKLPANQIIGLCIQMKSIFDVNIGSEDFTLLFYKVVYNKYFRNHINNKIDISNYENYNNNINNIKFKF